MKHCVRLFSLLSTGALLGCSQLSLAPTVDGQVAAIGSRVPTQPRIQPLERISSPVPEVEGIFIVGRSAHGAGQLALAEERYRQVLKLQPSHLGALNSIAVIYAQTGRIDEALQTFKHALELDPQSSHVRNNLGYTLLRDGQLDKAERELQLAHQQSPSSSQTRQNIELLDRAKEQLAARPQLVAIAPHVYELRDPPAAASLPTQPQTSTAAGVPLDKPIAEAAGPVARPDRAIEGALRGVRIEVSNGVGIRYLARRTAERLAPMGVVTARLTNQPRYQQAKTEIQFSAGQGGAADALATKLPVVVRAVPSARLANNIQMRLVLGHDLAGKAVAAWLEASSETRVALAADDGWRWS